MAETPEQRELRELREEQARLRETNHQLQGTLTALMARLFNEQDRRNEEPPPRREDRSLKVEVHAFDGSLDPEKYLEWERSLENYFEFKDLEDEEARYKIAKVKLKGYGADWLKGEQKNRTLRRKEPIATWEKLKKRMRDRFIPSNYMQTQYVKWSTLQQGYGSVEEYIREFDRLSIVCDVTENEELKLGRFLAGLNVDLREKLEAYTNLTFHDACKMATKFDASKKKKKTITNPFDPKSFKTPTKESSSKQPFTPSKETPQKKPTQDLSDIVCYKCRGRGHYQKDCPNPRALTTREFRAMAGQFLAHENETDEEEQEPVDDEEEEPT